ncbi:cysteine desulfurase NifS [Blastopirellula marina]|uniref:Cysteine desulfurase NifS n=1 Tax=Blastopirellula marina TaxID=124 RepID=A0A2S8G744_9BACT|nr:MULTISPECIES: cysteine desulfurase family protein [Pirellulaceae]PQO40285.1 cysteine desulfurase NifS [Blastopirellula marina]RCS55833.1 cysteine desulfurase [Bremerella cremea]
MKSIFLDYNATTPIAPSVQEAMIPFMAEYFACPDGMYARSRAIDEALEDARGQVAHLLGATPDEIVFCASGTESCNLAIKGIAYRYLSERKPCHIIVSAIEHAAVAQTANHCRTMGCDVSIVPVDRHGIVSPDALVQAIRPETKLVSVMLANDETGVIQPLNLLAQICQEHGVLLHSDACQAAGKIHLSPKQLGADLLSITAHKFYGPKGAAALYVKAGTALQPIIHGSGAEHSLRAGAENILAWVGMGKAANLVGRSIDDAAEKLTQLTRRFGRRLMESIPEPIVIHGSQVERIPNTLCVNFPQVSGQELLRRVPEICAATFCSDTVGCGNSSPVLAAMGVSDTDKLGTIRLSFGWYTSEEEVDQSADLLIHAWESLRH